MKQSILLSLLAMLYGSNANAAHCSQAIIEQKGMEEALEIKDKYVLAARVVVGKGMYIEGPNSRTGYFPVFYLSADCREFGTHRCNLSGVLLANLQTCSVASGPVNRNLIEPGVAPKSTGN